MKCCTLVKLLTLTALLLLQATTALAGPLGLPDRDTIAYLTDVEGDWNQIEDFLKDNPFVYLDETGQTQLRDGVTFVFGGDSIDKGEDDLRSTKWLVDLKKRYPDRVVLLAGNRDTLKIALPRLIDPAYVHSVPHLQKDWDTWLNGRPDVIDSPEERLRWALARRLGAPRAFELRRAGLAAERGTGLAAIPDSEILRSYLNELAPGGNLRFYLENSQLAYVRGNTLFVHGAVTKENFGLLPPEEARPEPERTGSAKQWVRRLNKWHRENIELWTQTGSYPKFYIEYHAKKGRGFEHPESIVYGRFSDEFGNPVPLPQEVKDWLISRGIRRLVVGHSRAGKVPAIVRERGFEVIIGDTSGAPHGSQLFISPNRVVLRSQAPLPTDSPGSATVHVPIEARWRLNDDSWLGRYVPGTKLLVKARTTDGRWVVSKVGDEKYEFHETLITDEELRTMVARHKAALDAACAGLYQTISGS